MDFNMLNNSVPNLNEITNINNLEKYNVIPNPGLQSKLINRPHKVIVPLNGATDSTKFEIELNETFKDVVSVKLLNGILAGKIVHESTNIEILYITVFIDELKKNHGPDNLFDTSFATLDFDNQVNINFDSNNHTHDIYKNCFDKHQDIKYFDPPLNSLSKLNITLQGFGTTLTNTIGKLELQIETKEKLRVY
jgi:hypothetical protein